MKAVTVPTGFPIETFSDVRRIIPSVCGYSPLNMGKVFIYQLVYGRESMHIFHFDVTDPH